MINIEELEISRIIVHRVHKKRDEDEFGIAEYSNNIFQFGDTELNTLKNRITTAFSKNKRFFKLQISDEGVDSFCKYSSSMKMCDGLNFISKSKSIADLLAKSHTKRTIPSGLLLVMDGNLNNKHFVLVIKAELQEAFTIKEVNDNKLIELINDLFLSPAKDFYKIGFIVEENLRAKDINDRHSCYMYDDNFSNGKKDLAEYFYSAFLGFTTSSNDKLVTKNFYDDVFKFIDTNIQSFEDKRGLKNAVNVLYRENTAGIINPQEFGEDHFEDELLRRFGADVGSKYPSSFTKDLTLVDRKLHRGQIVLLDDLKIEGPQDSLSNVSVINQNNINYEQLKLQIDNGEIKQIVTIRTEN
ncbi:nucleoid-associated protein [Flavobacterium beibuense]|uniref:nucleoid-associated protein n=1 Tax=Flavobacterium beibuense TaxID=657326 RepID=UPI003A93F51C